MFSHSSKKEIRLCSYLLSQFVLRKCLLQKHKLVMQEKWLKFSGGAKVAMFVFGKGCKALAELGPPQDCICPIQAQPQHEDLLSFAATQLCSEQCPSTEEKKKNNPNPGFGFSLPAPKPHVVQQKNGRWTNDSQDPFQCHEKKGFLSS